MTLAIHPRGLLDCTLRAVLSAVHCSVSENGGIWESDSGAQHMGRIFLEGYSSKLCLFFLEFDTSLLQHGAL